MLTNSKAFQGFSVNDIGAAKRFYGEKLGLDVEDGPMGMLSLNIDEAVDELTRRGVTFERYEGFDQDEKGIARPSEENQGPA